MWRKFSCVKKINPIKSFLLSLSKNFSSHSWTALNISTLATNLNPQLEGSEQEQSLDFSAIFESVHMPKFNYFWTLSKMAEKSRDHSCSEPSNYQSNTCMFKGTINLYLCWTIQSNCKLRECLTCKQPLCQNCAPVKISVELPKTNVSDSCYTYDPWKWLASNFSSHYHP